MEQAQRKYVAFISYRHLPVDADIAARLHRSIEGFRVPRGLRRAGEKRLGLVFRDEEELPASSDLSRDIRGALERSRFLIVVCTPDTPASEWVRREIRTFLETHDRTSVLAVLAAGEPAQSFPPDLTAGAIEPLAVDVRAASPGERHHKLRREIPRLYAALIGCPYDALAQRQQRRRVRRAASAASVVLAVALGFSGMLLWKNHQLAQRGEELFRQKQEARLSESRSLTEQAEGKLLQGETAGALREAIAALPSSGEDDRPYYAPAESVLMHGLQVWSGEGKEQPLVLENILERETPARDLAVSPDGSLLATVDAYGGVALYELPSGRERWATRLTTVSGKGVSFANGQYANIQFSQENNRLVLLADAYAVGIDLESGRVVWSTTAGELERMKNILAVSPDGSLIVCVNSRVDGYQMAITYTLEFRRADTGELAQEVFLGVSRHQDDFSMAYSDFTARRAPAAFSADGTRFAGAFFTDETRVTAYFFYDLPSGDARVLREGEGLRPVWMDLEQERLLVLRQGEAEYNGLVLEAIDAGTGALLWEREARADDRQYSVSNDQMEYRFLRVEDTLLAAADDMLYAFDARNGDLLAKERMSGRVLDLAPGDAGYFQIALADGGCGSGRISLLNGFVFTKDYPLGWYDLEAGATARIARGFLRVEERPGLADRFTAGEDGCVAVVPEDGRRIILQSARWTEGLATRRTIDLGGEFSFDDALGGLSVRGTADGGLLVSVRTEAMDAREREYGILRLPDGEGSPILYHRQNGARAWALEDGSGVIECGQAGRVTCTDLPSGESRVLWDGDSLLTASITSSMAGYFRDADSAYLSADGKLLTAACDSRSLQVFLDGEEKASTPLPQGVDWCYSHYDAFAHLLRAGENGCVLMSAYPPKAEEKRFDQFLLWDLADGAFSLVKDEGNGSTERVFALGRATGVFAVADVDDALRLYDRDGLVRAIETSFPAISVRLAQFSPDDGQIALYTADGRVAVYDCESGALLFWTDTGTAYGETLLLEKSPDGRRAYLLVGGSGGVVLCLDAESWTELGRAGNACGLDAAREEIWCYDPYGEGIYAWSVPAREELLAVARRVCGE